MCVECPGYVALQRDWKRAGIVALSNAEVLCAMGEINESLCELRRAVTLFREAEEWKKYYDAVQLLLVVALAGVERK